MARRWGRTAVDALLSDCQYRKGTALYGPCLTASTTRALLCMADAEFGIQVIAEAVVACREPEHCYLFPSC